MNGINTRRAALAGALLLALTGCGDSGPTRTRFAVSIAGGQATDLANDHNYLVTLQEARLGVGPVRFFSGEPLFSSRESWPVRWGRAILGIGLAHAHPGHYQEGDALAEVLATDTFDLLGEPRPLGQANGVTGTYRSVQVTLSPEGGHTATVRGQASKPGAATVVFEATLDLDEKVAGITAGDMAVDSTVHGARITVELAKWVEQIDFGGLAAGQGTVTFQPGGQAYNALYRGITNTSAFSLSWAVE